MNDSERVMTADELAALRQRTDAAEARANRDRDSHLLVSNGKPVACEANIYELLSRDYPYTARTLHFDSFWRDIRCGDPPVKWEDSHDRAALLWVQRNAIPRATLNMIRTAVQSIAEERKRDALVDFVQSLPPWDGTPRTALALQEAFGAPASEIMATASSNLFRAMIARALRPGVKVDSIFVLEGPQGALKSSAFQALGGAFHAEVTEPLGSPNCIREIRCAWLAELTELRALVGRDAETTKSFLTRLADPLVEKWEKHVTLYPRRCVFIGTTNEHHYWDDPTGARRLVPIPCGEIRVDLIEANRFQWFAEALVEFKAGATWWEFPVEIDEARDERQKTDPWEPAIEKFLVGKSETTVPQLLDDAIQMDLAKRTARDDQRVAAVLRKLDWHAMPRRREPGIGRVRPWRRDA